MFSTMVLTVLRFTAGVGTAHAVKTSPRRKEEEKWDNGNVHRAAAKIIVSKSRAARGSVCNPLLSAAIQRESHRPKDTAVDRLVFL